MYVLFEIVRYTMSLRIAQALALIAAEVLFNSVPRSKHINIESNKIACNASSYA